jgi:subtilisin
MSRIEEELRATGLAQVIVILKQPPARRAALERGAAAEVAAQPDLAGVSRALEKYFTASQFSHEGALAMAMRPAPARAGARGALERGKAAAPPKARMYPNLGLMLGTVDKQGLQGLKKDERVQAVKAAPHLSLIRPVAAQDTKLAGGVTWGLDRLEIPKVWEQGFTGKGVLVGHLDTGVDGDHPALKGAIDHFAEFDPMGEPVPGAQPHDSDEHGTHTAGTIAGRKVRSTAFGVAPEAMLASAIVIEGGNVIARILAGMDWVVGLGARVLSMSLGLRGFQEDFLPVTRILRARGVLPVFAVGNEGPGTSRSPGNYAEALSVGASNADDEVADFSSSQKFIRPDDPLVPDLVGPGVDVISSVPGGGYQKMSGSSMATPHIAGLAALLFQAKPSATVDEVEAAIFASCVLPSSMPDDRANRGVPNGPGALEALLAGTATEAARTAGAGKPKPKKKHAVKTKAKTKPKTAVRK